MDSSVLKTSVFRRRSAQTLGGLMALAACAGTMRATTNTLLAPVTQVNVSCTIATTGPGAAATITIKPLAAITGSNTITVTFAAPATMTVVAPVGAGANVLKLANQTAGIAFTVNTNAGCASATSGVTGVQFSSQANVGIAGTGLLGTDILVNVNDTLSLVSGLSSAGATLQCTFNSGTYTPGPAQTVSVTSTETGGTSFTLDTTVGNDPTWLTLNPTTLGPVTATGTATTFTVKLTGPASTTACNEAAWPSGSHTFNLHLQNGLSPDFLVPITVNIVAPGILSVAPIAPATSFSLSYVKTTGTVQTIGANVTSTSIPVPTPFFVVNTNGISWLSASPVSGSAPLAVHFSTTTSTDSLAPGTYTATVKFQVSGYADTPVTVTLLVTNKPAMLSVTTAAGAGATTVNLNWALGSPPPTTTITALSTDSPIAYSTKSAGPLAPIVQADEASGLAYSFGTNIGIAFNPLLFASAAPGTTLSGTVTFTWGTPVSVTVVTINLHVVSPGAALTSIFPASTPTATTGTAVITLIGSGFVKSSDSTLATRVGIVSNGTLITDNNLSWVVNPPSNIVLTITVPGASQPDCPNLPFSPTVLCAGVIGGPVYLGVANGTGTTAATGTATLIIGSNPIIQGVTSSSSFTEVTGALPTFAPYDMISLFGANFCSAGAVATNCSGGSSPTILPGVPNTTTLIYPISLSPDGPVTVSTPFPRQLTVTFYPHGLTSPAWPAPLLFATNGQINAIVPAAVGFSPYLGPGTVDIVVGFGNAGASPSTLQKSAAFNVNIAGSDPGVFTIGSSGQGAAAALSASYTLITNANPAGMRSGLAASDTIQLYVTGLGLPLSTYDALTTGSYIPITNCVAAVSGAGNFMTTLQGTFASPVLTNIDGAVIQSALIASGDFPPCLTTQPTVTIGGLPGAVGAVTYAGFVDDTVAGLYQIDVQLPSTFKSGSPLTDVNGVSITTLTAPATLPVLVTIGSGPGVTSQAGVTLQVAPSLLMTPPSNLTTLGVGQDYSSPVAASLGTPAYTYALAPTSGALPAGLSLNQNTGVISGEPAQKTAGIYAVTVTATDSAVPPVTGSINFTMTVAGGLYVTFTVPALEPTPFAVTGTFGSGTLTPALGSGNVVAIGGTPAYTYALTTPVTAGMAFSTSTHDLVIASPATLLAGYYPITITATDSLAVTGTVNFPVVQALELAYGSITAQTAGTSTTIVQVNTAGGASGTPTYTITDAATIADGFEVDPATGNVTANGVGAATGTYTIVVNATDSAMPTGATAPGVGTITISGVGVL